MPEAQTRSFGVLQYDDSAVVSFPQGLPGFEEQRQFLFVEQPATQPLVFVQSLARPDLCFITLPVRVVAPDYGLSVSQEDLHELGLPPGRQPRCGEDVLCLTILSFHENRPPTANLLSPIVLNLKSRVAVQSIQVDSDYAIQHSIPEAESC